MPTPARRTDDGTQRCPSSRFRRGGSWEGLSSGSIRWGPGAGAQARGGIRRRAGRGPGVLEGRSWTRASTVKSRPRRRRRRCRSLSAPVSPARVRPAARRSVDVSHGCNRTSRCPPWTLPRLGPVALRRARIARRSRLWPRSNSSRPSRPSLRLQSCNLDPACSSTTRSSTRVARRG